MEKITNNQTRPKRAVAYARTSKRHFSSKSSSIQSLLEKQFTEIREYAAKNNIEVVDYFFDVGKSARDAKRPGLQRMIHYTDNYCGEIDYVIVQNISRLTRDVRSYFVDIKSKLEPAGTHIRSVSEGFDETPKGQFTQMMRISQAQYYSNFYRELSKRHKAVTPQES